MITPERRLAPALKLGLLAALVVGVGGCIRIKPQTPPPPPDGFVQRSDNGGQTWTQVATLLRPGAPSQSLGNTAVTVFVQDPTDPKALYAGTRESGMVYSYSSGNGWMVTLENIGPIAAISVDPLDRCTMYVGIGKVVHKSVDCARNWEPTTVAIGAAGNQISALLADRAVAGRVFAGTTLGELHQSDDGGKTWRIIHTFGSPPKAILRNPNDANLMYVATAGAGLWRTADAGVEWQDVSPHETGGRLRVLRGAPVLIDVALDLNVRDGLVYASGAGLHRSDDGGATWKAIELPLTLVRGVSIGQVLVHPTEPNTLYVTVGQNLIRSGDGGLNWSTVTLPSARPLVELVQPTQAPEAMFAAFGPGPQTR